MKGIKKTERQGWSQVKGTIILSLGTRPSTIQRNFRAGTKGNKESFNVSEAALRLASTGAESVLDEIICELLLERGIVDRISSLSETKMRRRIPPRWTHLPLQSHLALDARYLSHAAEASAELQSSNMEGVGDRGVRMGESDDTNSPSHDNVPVSNASVAISRSATGEGRLEEGQSDRRVNVREKETRARNALNSGRIGSILRRPEVAIFAEYVLERMLFALIEESLDGECETRSEHSFRS
jgi:hypothetical protein